MNPSLTINIATQLAEEKTPIAYTPFFFANQIFIVAHQMIRRTENIASFGFGVLTASGEVLQIDPSLNWTLLTLFINHLNQYQSTLPILAAPQVVQQTVFPQNRVCEPMDMTPMRFTSTKSTSSTEISTQKVDYPSRSHNNGRYLVIDMRNRNCLGEVFKNIEELEENCLQMNARQQQKVRKEKFDGSFC